MFDPKILVSPKNILLKSLKSALTEILLSKENTKVLDIKKNNAYYNTIAVVNNVDNHGNITRENRDIWYDRVELPAVELKHGSDIKTDNNITMCRILTDTVSETKHNATPTQLAKALSLTYNYGIEESDLKFDKKIVDLSKSTAIGTIYSTLNCEVRGNTTYYVGGYCSAPRDVFNIYNDKSDSNEIQPGMSIIKEWQQGETLKLSLPSVKAGEDWNIVVEDIQEIGNTTVGTRILDITTSEKNTVDVNIDRWLMSVDSQVVAILDKHNVNDVLLSITDGSITAIGRNKENESVTIKSTTPKTTEVNGLYRITVYTRNSIPQKLKLTMQMIPAQDNDIIVSNGPSELINFKPRINAYDGLNDYRYLLDDSAGILSGYYFGALKYNIVADKDFNIKIFNGLNQGGDYSGISAGGSTSIVILEEENYIETLRNGYNTDFVDSNILRVGQFYTKELYGNKMYVNDVLFDQTEKGTLNGIEVNINSVTNEVSYDITYIVDAETKETQSNTGILDVNIARFNKPIVLILNCTQADMTSNILQFQIESTALPSLKKQIDNIVENYLISSINNSTAVVGGFDKPISLTNVITTGYVEADIGVFKSRLKNPKENKGNITSLQRFESNETIELIGHVYDFGKLVNDKLIKQFYIEINNTLNVLSKFKVIFDVTEDDVTLTVINDGVVIQTRSVTIERTENNPFIVKINETEMSVTYGDSKKISNPTHNYVGLTDVRRYRVELGVETTSIINLPELNITQTVYQTQGEL